MERGLHPALSGRPTNWSDAAAAIRIAVIRCKRKIVVGANQRVATKSQYERSHIEQKRSLPGFVLVGFPWLKVDVSHFLQVMDLGLQFHEDTA